MSEKDMKLGGVAATKFASKNAYDGASSATYKSSDQVREHYLSEMERLNDSKEADQSTSSSNVPDFWESRQKERNLEAKQMGVFSHQANNMRQLTPSASPPTSSTTSSEGSTSDGRTSSPEVALIQIATNTLETMAAVMENNSQTKIPMSERTAFANAVKRAMAALAKQST